MKFNVNYVVVTFAMVLQLWSWPFCDCLKEEDAEGVFCANGPLRLILSNFLKDAKNSNNLSITILDQTVSLEPVSDPNMMNFFNITFVNVSDCSRDVKYSPRWCYHGRIGDNNNNVKSAVFATIDEAGKLFGAFKIRNSTCYIEPSKKKKEDWEFGSDSTLDPYDLFCSQQMNDFDVAANENSVGFSQNQQPMWSQIWGDVNGDYSKHQKRQTKQSSIVCDLKIVVDYPFYKYVAKSSRDKAVLIVTRIVSKVDNIFRSADFDRDGKPENFRFFISDIKVYLDPWPNSSNYSEWNPTAFFTELRNYDFGDACAGLLFTYRKMQSPELYGPSIFKSTINSSEFGLCFSRSSSPSIPSEVMENYGSYIANAVPVNFMFQNEVFKNQDHLAIQAAHQIAQLFGAPTDDDTKDCNATNPEGMSIMAYPVPPGNYQSNNEFSVCSRVAITDYLKNMTRPCLRSCKGSVCCVKRAMKFPLPYDVVEGTTRDFATTSEVSGAVKLGPHLNAAVFQITLLYLVLCFPF